MPDGAYNHGIEMSLAAHESTLESSLRPASVLKNGKNNGNSVGHAKSRSKKIWIDLENSPHVPFFRPIAEELQRRGCTVLLTARDCFQVRELADLFGLQYYLVGRHYGKHRIAKVLGLGIRMLQMVPFALRQKPDLALSHGSRSQFLVSVALRIPMLTVTDYEHAYWMGSSRDSWVVAPEVIPQAALRGKGYGDDRILRYPGIKEDVYVPTFKPDESCRRRLALSKEDLVILVRPPATEAHYHNPESEKLLNAVFEAVSHHQNAKVVLLPRTSRQESDLRKQWLPLFKDGRIVVPPQVMDGLDLIWCSDLVISGGGTMNREAAALGVPVYSIFRGRIGAVDEYLAKAGRLILLQSEEDVAHKIGFVRRNGNSDPSSNGQRTLQTIVNHVSRLVGLEL